MTESVFICFSQKNSTLDNLMYDLYEIASSSKFINAFNTADDFILSIQTKLQKEIFPIVIIEFDESVQLAQQLISKIRMLKKDLFILSLGSPTTLKSIKNANPDDFAIQYLVNPYSKDALEFAVHSVQLLTQVAKRIEFQEKNEKEIEEKVNESLQKLIDSNMAKDQFLSIIAHDLKSPFQALIGVADILMNDWDNMNDEHKLEFIGDIRRTSSDTHKLLSNLLEWAKVQKEKLRISIAEVNVRELVDCTMRISNNHARVKNIKVINDISSHLKIQTDENMMATVFRNLISNAVQYTQPGGNINITAFETHDGCTFCVADNGEGIEKSHILEYFKKGSRKKLNGNSSAFKGLGLLICKDFVEKNGGEIWLETEKGQGSKFFFTVPC